MHSKPAWDVEELRLLEQGYTPSWDPRDEGLVQSLSCTRDGRMLAHVGVSKGRAALVFGVCPACQEWLSFHGARR